MGDQKTVRCPEVTVQLTGRDGNVFAIMGRVSDALRQAGYSNLVDEFVADVTDASSYSEALHRVMSWVEVE
ncbi:hypothetical protein SEA_CEPENS_91 [Mycobacterium phage Cepens]|uniref:Uncharacterized protein n=1 Tax=Mycobacterium phage Taptic TaxID=1920305 RepID=A0A1J0ME87_9CAUD|nr:hypothetical protein PQB71_gp73 [Mycobacterium phage Taptic]APD19317.1 hypothetical protein SEA_TAPTIC_92 [Mycobacterium phage Taptic]QBP32750.1 hypothetical protein SEA_CEPENS_91 [Mycobacterium phage Cepens]WRQ08255.1 hypothetical protein JDBV14_00705 [Mycobacterium phage harman]